MGKKAVFTRVNYTYILNNNTMKNKDKNTENWQIPTKPYYNTEVVPIETQRFKYFKNPFTNRLIPVYCHFQGEKDLFTVSVGNNSDYSYSGTTPNRCSNIDEFTKEIDLMYEKGKLIY